MTEMPQNGDLRLNNGSKMGQKWSKFSFLSAEMTGTQVKSVKIVDPQLDTIMSCKKNEIPAEKKTFSGSFWPKMGKNGQNCEK